MTISDVDKKLYQRTNSSYQTLGDVPHPFLMKDMEKSALRISEAIDKNEKILLVGDYDVDGISSTSIIILFFQKYVKNINFHWVIPDREKHGYGVSSKILEENQGYDLVFTVDNGISAIEAGKYCKERNIDLIITDHHTIPEEIPTAYSIVNPQQKECAFPFKEICGAEIAWYLIKSIAFVRNIKMENSTEFLEIVGMAIVSDVMPLVGLNRVLLKKALRQMNNSKMPFFLTMKKFIYGDAFKSEDIAFKVAPMLNSSGRLAHSSKSVEAIISFTIEEAFFKISELENINNQRKELEKEIFKEVLLDADINKNPAIIICGEWETGIIGIIASRLVERFEKPVLVFSTKTGSDIIKASGRSLGNINLIESLRQFPSYFVGLGGHSMAAGCSMEEYKLNEFKKVFFEYLNSNYNDNDFFIKDSSSLGEINFQDIDERLYNIIDKYEPYGEQNPSPKFNGIYTISDFKILKDVHIKFTLFDEKNGIVKDAIFFNAEKYIEKVSIGKKININFSISKNVFRNNISYQLNIKNILDIIDI